MLRSMGGSLYLYYISIEVVVVGVGVGVDGMRGIRR